MSLKIVLLHFSKSRRMFRVNKRILLFIAGCVWIIAGVNILRIGILTWMHDAHYSVLKVGEAVIVFLLFLNFVFLRLFRKHSRRIAQKGEKNCPFSFFDAKGWIVMIFMITLGVGIRHSRLLPDSFISVFYTGLSSALIITGVLFLIQGKKQQ